MSAIITSFEKSLNGANDPSGPPTPTPADVREHARGDGDRIDRRELEPGRAASIASTSAPRMKIPM